MLKLRMWLIRKLIGRDIMVLANATVRLPYESNGTASLVINNTFLQEHKPWQDSYDFNASFGTYSLKQPTA